MTLKWLKRFREVVLTLIFSLVFNFLIEELTHFIINSRLNK